MRRKPTLVQTDAVPRTIKDHRLFQNHASRHIIINTDGEEETVPLKTTDYSRTTHQETS